MLFSTVTTHTQHATLTAGKIFVHLFGAKNTLHSILLHRPLRISNEEALLRYIIDTIFLFAFMLALIFHSHQTEATYRLDFIWKLQATGK